MLGDLKALTYLNLAFNLLTGTIPSKFGDLNAMVELLLNTNQLTGSIPSELLGDLTALTGLYLYYNNLLTGRKKTKC